MAAPPLRRGRSALRASGASGDASSAAMQSLSAPPMPAISSSPQRGRKRGRPRGSTSKRKKSRSAHHHDEHEDDEEESIEAVGGKSGWSCAVCTMRNAADALACTMCQSSRPTSAAAGTWTCSRCTMVNEDASTRCDACGITRAVSEEDIVEVDLTGGASASPAVGSDSVRLLTSGHIGLEENHVFLAGVEEAFGHMVSPTLLSRIAQLARRPWQSASTLLSGRDPRVLTTPAVHAMQKALTRVSCERAVKLARTMQTLIEAMELERQEMHAGACILCHARGSERPLLYSANCATAGQKHFVCSSPCAAAYVMDRVKHGNTYIECPHDACEKEVDLVFVKRCLSRAEFVAYSDACFATSIADPTKFQKCPKCSSPTEVVATTAPIAVPQGGIQITDDAGKVLSEEAFAHYSSFRLRCRTCDANFCTSCRALPYHLGHTCEGHRAYVAAVHCRYCQDTLDETAAATALATGLPVCGAESCQQYQKRACTHRYERCRHACFGVIGEADHPHCMNEECEEAAEDVPAAASPTSHLPSSTPRLPYSGDDLCSICYVDELRSAPVIRLSSCGHVLHEHCVLSKLRQGPPSARLTFGFLECPTCKVRMDHPSDAIQSLLAPAVRQYEEIGAKAEARLRIEGMLSDDKLTQPHSRFFGRPRQYAMDSFAYYKCFKCKAAYFGGRRDCEQNAAAEAQPAEDFVCYECADLKSVKCQFPDHSEFQLWKCRFCCSPAVWFCFGSTHFCDPCHVRPGAVMHRKKKDTPQCPGADKCPLKSAHAPNGPDANCEHNLGCAVCEEQLQKKRDERQKEAKVTAAAAAAIAAAATESKQT